MRNSTSGVKNSIASSAAGSGPVRFVSQSTATRNALRERVRAWAGQRDGTGRDGTSERASQAPRACVRLQLLGRSPVGEHHQRDRDARRVHQCQRVAGRHYNHHHGEPEERVDQREVQLRAPVP
jgi:hypothetical protein